MKRKKNSVIQGSPGLVTKPRARAEADKESWLFLVKFWSTTLGNGNLYYFRSGV